MALKDLEEEVDRNLFNDSYALADSIRTSFHEDLQYMAISTIVGLVWNETIEECVYKLVENVATFNVKEEFLYFLNHLCRFSSPSIYYWA